MPLRLLVLLAVALSSLATTAAEPPKQIQAVRIAETGGTDVLKLESIDVPQPGEGEILVRVRAAGVNPVDAKMRASGAFLGEDRMPFTLGFDVSGTVVAVGDGVESFTEGDDILAMLDLRRGGGYAEYAIVKPSEAAKKPESLSFEQAAGVPLVALTAHQALFEHAKLKAGETVLIHGGSGGVGSHAVQLAKAAGATVIATASDRNQDYLKKLGADVCVDYRSQNFEDVAKDVDVVLDTVGGDTQKRSFDVLREGGRLVSIVGLPHRELAEPAGVAAIGFLVRPDGGQLATIAAMFDGGKLQPAALETLPLADAPKAHEQIETGHTRGKLVLVTE